MRVNSSTSQDRACWGLLVCLFVFGCLGVFLFWGFVFFSFGDDTSVFSESSASLEPRTLFVHFHFHRGFFFLLLHLKENKDFGYHHSCNWSPGISVFQSLNDDT